MSENRTEGILRWRHAVTATISLYLSFFCEVIPPLLPKSILLPSVSFSTLHFPRKASFLFLCLHFLFWHFPFQKRQRKKKNRRKEERNFCTVRKPAEQEQDPFSPSLPCLLNLESLPSSSSLRPSLKSSLFCEQVSGASLLPPPFFAFLFFLFLRQPFLPFRQTADCVKFFRFRCGSAFFFPLSPQGGRSLGGGGEEKEASSSRGLFYCFRRENERRKGQQCVAQLFRLFLGMPLLACVRNGVGGTCVEGREPEIKDGIEPEMEKVDRQNLLGPGAN